MLNSPSGLGHMARLSRCAIDQHEIYAWVFPMNPCAGSWIYIWRSPTFSLDHSWRKCLAIGYLFRDVEVLPDHLTPTTRVHRLIAGPEIGWAYYAKRTEVLAKNHV
jgi:hypothetical protein